MYLEYAEKLKSVELFDALDAREIGKVLKCLNAKIKSYKKDEYIHVQGDTFHEIGIALQGHVRIMKEWIDGTYWEIDNLKPYDTFGEDIICSESDCSPYSILAITDVVIMYVDGRKLISSESTGCQYRSQMNLNMLKRIAKYSMYINKEVQYARIISLKKRVATFIFDIYQSKNNKIFSIDMNREQMASYLNATRPAVSKILMEYKKENIIDYDKNQFKIVSEEKLVEEMS